MLKKLISENLYRWEKESMAPPTQMSITPTNVCNLQCQSCWQRDKSLYSNAHHKPEEISEQKLYDIIRQAGALGVRCIELTGGGEPLVRKTATVGLIKEIKNRSMIGWMTSNGTLFFSDIIKLMVALEWDKLTVSLDAPDAKTNDFLRPPAGSFEKVIHTLSLFNECKKLFHKDVPAITLNVVVSKYNINKLSEMISLASHYGVQGVTFEPVKVLASGCKELLVDFEKEYDRIMKELEKTQVAASESGIFTNIEGLMRTPELIKHSGKLLKSMPVNASCGGENKLLQVFCIEPWFHIYVEADGNVRPCCVNAGFGENINNKSLKDIWVGEKFSSFRNAIITENYPLSCNQCNANLICFSREIQGFLKETLTSTSGILPVIECMPSGQLPGRGLRRIPQAREQLKVVITDTASLYPPLWGGPKRIWNLYGNFSQDLFDIVYVGVKGNPENTLKYNFRKIRDNFKEILSDFPPHYCLWHAFEKSFFKNTSLDLFSYLWMDTDWQFKHILNSHDKDIIICSHPWSSLSVCKGKSLFIYDAHNCEYLLMDQILGRHPLKKIILRRVRQIEGDACRKSDFILVCSEKEKQDFIDLYGVDINKIMLVPNGANAPNSDGAGVDKQAYRKKLSLGIDDDVVIFVGAYYKPNIDASRFIITRLATQLKEVKFIIAGTVYDVFRDQEIPKNAKLLGRLTDEELDIALKSADIAINPMFDGSGINIKMLDYMSYGLPVVTTEMGARGIETEGRHPMIISNADNFVGNIKQLLINKPACKEMSEAGIALIKKRYDWKTISSKLENSILEEFYERQGGG